MRGHPDIFDEAGPMMSQVEVGKRMGVSKSRIQFMEKRAIRKMREAAEREAAAEGKSVREWLIGEIE